MKGAVMKANVSREWVAATYLFVEVPAPRIPSLVMGCACAVGGLWWAMRDAYRFGQKWTGLSWGTALGRAAAPAGFSVPVAHRRGFKGRWSVAASAT